MVVCLFEYEKEISGCLVYMVHTIRQPENRSAILPDFAAQCVGLYFEIMLASPTAFQAAAMVSGCRNGFRLPQRTRFPVPEQNKCFTKQPPLNKTQQIACAPPQACIQCAASRPDSSVGRATD
ncbi:hypothetical protein [Kingella oralis]|uniref:hypothetical protein n=1 Tax=Kingella oralis TaxID=505 RepID=UPI002D805F54|nr:hypothetical protein [Kingella oralis]